MILIKANGELKTVFTRMIHTMGVNVTWTGTFAVLNNYLILPGTVRSLIFNFDNRKVTTNIMELPVEQENAEETEGYETLTNVLNMTLYAFGKWGTIKGLKVDQDYNQLNQLFSAILKEIKVEPGYRNDNFRFYRNGIQMTYEEVIQEALEDGRRKAAGETEEEEKEEEQRLGLWHKIHWRREHCTFGKTEINPKEQMISRLGNNFYATGHLCPGCGEKLHMVVYPVNHEMLIETDEGKVYLARAYTCDECNCFYTPRPQKLLREGDIYTQRFGDDRVAYEDYRELLGSRGERTSNYKFNEYESQRGKSGKRQETLEEACENLEELSEKELELLEEKIQEGFYSAGREKRGRKASGESSYAIETGRYYEQVKAALKKKKQNPAGKSSGGQASRNTSGNITGEERKIHREMSGAHGERFGAKRAGAHGENSSHTINTKGKAAENKAFCESPAKEKAIGGNDTDIQKKSAEEKYNARMAVLDRMSPRQLREFKTQMQSETNLPEARKQEYMGQVEAAISRKEEQEIRKKASDCQGKSYAHMKRIAEEVSKSDCPQPVKEPILEKLRQQMKERAQQEIEQLMQNLPLNMSKNQYETFSEKLTQYQELDVSACQRQLKERRNQAEKQEIAALLRRAGRRDRNTLVQLAERLKQENYGDENTAEVLAEIQDKIRAIDEAAIDRICPDIMGMSFEEGVAAYEQIESGVFLPELKTNTLEMIDKRLTKLKMDECALLVEKLRGELEKKLPKDDRLHYYEVRKIMRGDWEETEADIVARALNTYAGDRSRYEFPIIICDSSPRKNGKEGFVLTPEHLFYNSTFNCEAIPIRSIENIEGNTGLLNKGIYVKRKNGNKTKIPGGISAKEWKVFGEVLDKFVGYLQEKPESRNISYLVKEKHEIKCCYRCGFTYKGGNVCPKCGNRANN